MRASRYHLYLRPENTLFLGYLLIDDMSTLNDDCYQFSLLLHALLWRLTDIHVLIIFLTCLRKLERLLFHLYLLFNIETNSIPQYLKSTLMMGFWGFGDSNSFPLNNLLILFLFFVRSLLLNHTLIKYFLISIILSNLIYPPRQWWIWFFFTISKLSQG